LGKLPDLSKLDLHTLQYNLISFDGNFTPQFLHMYDFSSMINATYVVILNSHHMYSNLHLFLFPNKYLDL